MLVGERQSGPSGGDGPDGHDSDGAYDAIAADPRRRAARRGVIGVLAGALIMLVVGAALAATGQEVGPLGLSGQSSSPAGPAPSSSGDEARPTLTTAAGRCLTWARDDASDVREVDCVQPHLFESVGPVTATPPPGTPFPADAAWQQLVTDQCTPLARTYLQDKLDPAGRYRPGALKPTQAAWDGGDRTVRCGLQAPGRTGALFPSRGRVADADQAVVFDPGVCLALVGKEVSDPVACGETHAAEVAGTVDLTSQFPSAFPSVDDQDNYLQPTCARLAEQYVGSAQRLTDSKLTVYWTNIGADSWTAGTRRVSCNLGSLLADNSGFAPLRGKAAEGVTIGGDAPTSIPSLRPGAPADVPGSAAPAPAQDSAATGGNAGEPAAPTSTGGAAPALPVPELPVGGGGGY
jgi:hypothetical protein